MDFFAIRFLFQLRNKQFQYILLENQFFFAHCRKNTANMVHFDENGKNMKGCVNLVNKNV